MKYLLYLLIQLEREVLIRKNILTSRAVQWPTAHLSDQS